MRKPRLSKAEKKMFQEMVNYSIESLNDDEYYSKAEVKAVDTLIDKLFDYFDV